jgi:exosortase/archaeosortase family protein
MKFRKTFTDIRQKYKELSLTGTLMRLGMLLILYPIGHYIPFWMSKAPILFSVMQILYEWVSVFIVNGSILMLKLFYPTILADANHVIYIHGTGIVFLSPPCTGLDPMIRMAFIFLFYPLKIKIKLWVLPLSILFILVAATIHFIMLITIVYEAKEWYRFSHEWLTKVIFYGFYFMVWVMWENILKNKKAINTKD